MEWNTIERKWHEMALRLQAVQSSAPQDTPSRQMQGEIRFDKTAAARAALPAKPAASMGDSKATRAAL
jgi:hypothetical protein